MQTQSATRFYAKKMPHFHNSLSAVANFRISGRAPIPRKEKQKEKYEAQKRREHGAIRHGLGSHCDKHGRLTNTQHELSE